MPQALTFRLEDIDPPQPAAQEPFVFSLDEIDPPDTISADASRDPRATPASPPVGAVPPAGVDPPRRTFASLLVPGRRHEETVAGRLGGGRAAFGKSDTLTDVARQSTGGPPRTDYYTEVTASAPQADTPQSGPPRTAMDRVEGVPRSLAAGALRFNTGFWGTMRAGAEALGLSGAAEWLKQAGDQATEMADATRGNLSSAGLLEQAAYGGLESIGMMAPSIAAGVASGLPSATLGLMGALTAGESYGTARDKGASPATSAAYALSQGAIEVATEMIPVSRLLGDLAKNTGLMRTIMNQAVAEVPGEQVATALQDLNDWAVLNPEQPFRAYLAERPSAAAQTLVSTIVATVGMSAGSVALNRAVNGPSSSDVVREGVGGEAAEQVATEAERRAAEPTRTRVDGPPIRPVMPPVLPVEEPAPSPVAAVPPVVPSVTQPPTEGEAAGMAAAGPPITFDVSEIESTEPVAVPSVEEQPQTEYTGPTDIFGNPIPQEAEPVSLPTPPEQPQQGVRYELPARALKTDPGSLQYRGVVNAAGVESERAITSTYKPELGGVLLVWKNPEDGDTYVVNGHHRLDAAKRDDATVAVVYSQAATAKEARAEGALLNLREDNTSLADAVQFMVDTDLKTPDALEAVGIGARAKVSRQAASIASLEPHVRKQWQEGTVPDDVAAAIGAANLTVEQQEAAAEFYRDQDARGRAPTAHVMARAVDRIKDAPTVETDDGGQPDIFGNKQTKNVFADRMDLETYVLRELGKDKSKLRAAIREKERLARANTVVDVDQAKQMADESARAQAILNRLMRSKGPISDILNQAAGELAEGGDREAVRTRVLKDVTAAAEAEISGAAGPRHGPPRRRTAEAARTGVVPERAPAEIAEEPRKFSSTQVNLPEDVAGRVRALASTIPAADLADDGREAEPHITVQYGLETDDVEPLRQALAGQAPIVATFGKTSLFENDDADVVKVDIESPDLRRVREAIRQVVEAPGDTNPDYVPHATVGYVKPGKGKAYAGKADLEGQTVTIDRIVFSTRDRQTIEIPLTGKLKASGPPMRAPKKTGGKVVGSRPGDFVRFSLTSPKGEAVASITGRVTERGRVKVVSAMLPAGVEMSVKIGDIVERTDDWRPVAERDWPGIHDIDGRRTEAPDRLAADVADDGRAAVSLPSPSLPPKATSPPPGASRRRASTGAVPATTARMGLRIGSNVREIASFEEAGRLWDQLRGGMEEGGAGGASNAPGVTIVDLDSGKTLAHISYNGRMWEGEAKDWTSKTREIERADGRGYGKARAIEATAETPDESAPLPFTVENLASVFGVSEEVAQATFAMAEAMGLPLERVQIVKGGEPGEAALPQGGLFDEDVLETGERQPRLPGDVGAVREEERPTPQEELPPGEFRLTAQEAKPRKANQAGLLLDGEALFQAAYHGSPHVFDEFSLHKIGTGEGSQAYGWGLYFAGDKAVAKYYRDNLARPVVTVDGKPLHDLDTFYGAFVRNIVNDVEQGSTWSMAKKAALEDLRWREREAMRRLGLDKGHHRDELTEELEGLRDAIERIEPLDQSRVSKASGGRLYKVEIPDDGDYLDWDKPLGQQGEKTQSALRRVLGADNVQPVKRRSGEYSVARVGPEGVGRVVWDVRTPTPEAAMESWQRYLSEATGAELYRDLGKREEAGGFGRDFNGARAASERLASEGVAGIRYLDSSSRAKGEGTSNYVVFDDKLVQIMEFEQSAGQGAKASVEFMQAGEALIRALKSPDASSAIHELAHIARRWLLNRDVAAEHRAGVTDEDIATTEQWAGAKGGQWTREAEEKFARGFEHYLRDGGPTLPSKIRAVFQKFSTWLKDIYQTVTGSAIDVEVSPEMRQAFDRLVTRQSRVTAEGKPQKKVGGPPKKQRAASKTAPSGDASVAPGPTNLAVKTGTLPRPAGTLLSPPPPAPLTPTGAPLSELATIELPEMVEIAKVLSETPSVVKRFRGDGRIGDFTPDGPRAGRIRLLASLFARTEPLKADAQDGATVIQPATGAKFRVTGKNEHGYPILEPENGGASVTVSAEDITLGKYRIDVSKRNLQQLAKTLAHEIGHLVDWLPDKTMKRGNLLGRLKSLHSFLAHTYTSQGGEVIHRDDIRAELVKVSKAWRGDFDEKGKASYDRYRQRGKELYADAISALFNNPGWLEETAPTFYREFFEHLDQKSEVYDAYFGIQELLSGTREELVARRRAGVHEMFGMADTKALDIEQLRRQEREASKGNLWNRLRIELIDKNTPVIDRVKALVKRGTLLNPDEDPRYALKELRHLGAKQQGFISRTFQPVYEMTQEAGISWSHFGEALFYERIVSGDRSEMANPRGLSVESARELYDDLLKTMAPEQKKTLSKAIDKFRAGVREMAEDAYKAGLYKPEMYEQMRANPAWAAFRVVDHMEKDVTSKVHNQIGTLKDIQNPADATILKTLVTLRAVEYQRMKLKTFDALEKATPQDIEQSKQTWNGKGLVPVDPDDKSKVLVPYYEQGRLRGKYVPKDVADAIQNASIGQNLAALEGLRIANNSWFRPVFTTLNSGFQVANFARDFWRYWSNMPNATLRSSLKAYAKAVPMARVRAFGPPTKATASSVQAEGELMEATEARILGVTFNDLMANRPVEDTHIEELFAKHGLGGPPTTTPTGVVGRAKALADWISDVGNFIETLPKAAAIYEMRDGRSISELTAEERAFIREKVGSPDFLIGGTLKPITNELFLFSNAITQAIRADVDVATDPKTRSAFWRKNATAFMLPVALTFVVEQFGHLMAGDDDEEGEENGWRYVQRILQGVSEYDKTNYTIIPLALDDQGNSVYLRIPRSDAGRLLSALFRKMLLAGAGDAEVAESLAAIVDYTAGQVPGVTPTLDLVGDLKDYASGQNVYDSFRNREVFTRDEMDAGGLPKAQKFLAYEFQQMGGGIVYRVATGADRPRERTTAQKILELPVVSNVVGRFVRVTNYGQIERARKVQRQVRRDEAKARLAEKAAVADALRAYQKQPPPNRTRESQQKLARDVINRLYADATPAERLRQYKDVLKKIRMGAARGKSDPIVDTVMSATSTAQKAAIIREAFKDQSDSDRQAWLRQAMKEDVISASVVKAVREGAQR